MKDTLEQMKEDLEKSLEGMPEDAKEFALDLANFYILMETTKIVCKLIHEHKEDFEK